MSQHDYVIDNGTGSGVRADLNLALAAMATRNSGTGNPGTMYARMVMVDTTLGVVKRRNAANSAWIIESTDDETRVVLRSSNTQLDESDIGKCFVAAASFTQTIKAVASLGDGWYCFYNARGYNIDLDPNGSELIDGATTKRITGSGVVFCDGSALYTIGFVGATLTRNGCINGSCRVNGTSAATLSTTPQYGYVDMWAGWAAGGSVSAGTLTLDASSPVGIYGKAVYFQGVTLTGSGVLSMRQRIAAADAAFYKNKTVSFSAQVRQDTGGSLNAGVIIRKPTAADNYSGVTIINDLALVAVPNDTNTLLSSPAVAMGDCSNGIEIEFYITTGAITTKNIRFADMAMVEGSLVTDFPQESFVEDRLRCAFYFQKSYEQGTNHGAVTRTGMICLGLGSNTVGQQNAAEVRFPVPMRAAPTMAWWDGAGTSNKLSSRSNATWSDGVSTLASVSVSTENTIIDTGWGTGSNVYAHYTADARL